MAVASCKAAGDVYLFLGVKTVITVKKGCTDAERTARKLCKLVSAEEGRCFCSM